MNLTHLPIEEKQSKNKQLNKSYSKIFYVINEKHRELHLIFGFSKKK